VQCHALRLCKDREIYIYTYHNDENPKDEDYNPLLTEVEKWMGFEVLGPAYPGHSFYIRAFENGGYFIRDLRFPKNWGMNTPMPSETYSASAWKRDVIMKFGEWLERANEKRGAFEKGQEILHVEGVPQKHQPDYKPAVYIVDASGKPLRTTPMPQALNVH
jgi:hypothetical protein